MKNDAKLQLFLQISKYFRNFAPKFCKKKVKKYEF